MFNIKITSWNGGNREILDVDGSEKISKFLSTQARFVVMLDQAADTFSGIPNRSLITSGNCSLDVNTFEMSTMANNFLTQPIVLC